MDQEEGPQMRITGICLAVAGSIGLAACGGGGGDDDGPGGLNGGTQETFDILQSDFDALLSDYDRVAPTPPAGMPIGGTATYAGAAVYSNVATDPNVIIANPTSASKVEITADFAAMEIGGRLYDFRASDPDVRIDGGLALVNGFIVNNTVAADILGTLTVDGTDRDHTGARLLGAFQGEGARALSGPILRGGSPTEINGAFVAER
jgi:hypothetical protein